MSRRRISRRRMVRLAGGAILAGPLAPQLLLRAQDAERVPGCVIGAQAKGDAVGTQVLAEGGNAIDAIVAAALAAAVTELHQTGIGGYGGSATFAVDGGRRVVSLEFNSMAPAAMRPDFFKPGPDGKPTVDHNFGWFATGVPGNLAGLQLALDRFGTKPFSEIVAPAIRLAREGFVVTAGYQRILNNAAAQFRKDAGSSKLYLKDGRPIPVGERLSNPDLAAMLTTLAERNSVESFYRGDIAQHIADAFQKNGGLVTAMDMAAYKAHVVQPLTLTWGDATMHTAPLTAGGLTTLQALAAMKALDWKSTPDGVEKTMARVEALRLAWHDRLTLLGDPAYSKVPVTRLLSDHYALESAERVRAAVKAGKPMAYGVTAREQGGTISIAAVDRQGNLAALTLTHGNGFGARVTVDGLGLTLGHGMSRFDIEPDHPNAPGPGKRPLHNMCPTVVTRDGRAFLAAGARGGRKIPNAICDLLLAHVVNGVSPGKAILTPRMHTEGELALTLEPTWPEAEAAALGKLGYKVTSGASATISLAGFDAASGRVSKGMR